MAETPSGKIRFEMTFDPDMIAAIQTAAHRRALAPSQWIKSLCARELDREIKNWRQDHPRGDQEKAS